MFARVIMERRAPPTRWTPGLKNRMAFSATVL